STSSQVTQEQTAAPQAPQEQPQEDPSGIPAPQVTESELQPEPRPEDEPEEETLYKEPVSLDGVVFFTLYQKGGEQEDLQQLAKQASEKLSRALASTTIEAAAESLRFERTRKSLSVYISELQIITLKPHHLESAGLLSFEQYQKEIEGQIRKGLQERLNKAKWQK